MSDTGLECLRTLLRDNGGLMARLVLAPESSETDTTAAANGQSTANANANPEADGARPLCLNADGPRVEGRREDYELLIEAIYEGYLLHYEEPRVLRVPEADLRLLAGDRLYAIGLARLVDLGDTFAVAELADTITLSSLAQGAEDRALADAVWIAGVRAVCWGPSEAHRLAKDLLFAGDPGGFEAMRTSTAASPTSP